jgi:hypothetical protein
MVVCLSCFVAAPRYPEVGPGRPWLHLRTQVRQREGFAPPTPFRHNGLTPDVKGKIA